jgi:telomerase Cajal body protein 1
LSPYSILRCPEPSYAVTSYPLFNLSDPATTLVLSSPRDLPIRLSNALYPSVLATYPLISPTTEAYATPSSLLFSSGTHFLTGTDSLIALFDLSRDGSGPLTRLPTIPSKRHKMKGSGIGMRGIVSALSLQPVSSSDDPSTESLLAAGTWTRWVSLYDASGLGGTVANWTIASAADSEAMIGGAGVSQTIWSPCGRYLFVVERKSSGVLIYDIRVTRRLVGWLEGRVAETNQRLGVDVFTAAGEGPCEVWAGGVDGTLRAWRNVAMNEGPKRPDWQWVAHESVVSGAVVHPSGTVVATCSGKRMELDFDTESESESDGDDGSGEDGYSKNNLRQRAPDNSIKIWSL